ncbi:MAG: heavy metal-responsive transcriptional regulator [Chloroflexi bacterium]|nr:heavy metal-responsive transcriptional regulator [Chloroflexota bacterium]
MPETLQIGQVARNLGLNPTTIRYYEDIGLLPEPKRTLSGYRQYSAPDVERIDFIRRARTLELSLDEIGEILSFRDQGEAPCPYVLHLIAAKITQVERKIDGLRQLHRELRDLHAEAAALSLDTLASKGHLCHIIENRRLETNGEPVPA